jgi:hypothetical protein
MHSHLRILKLILKLNVQFFIKFEKIDFLRYLWLNHMSQVEQIISCPVCKSQTIFPEDSKTHYRTYYSCTNKHKFYIYFSHFNGRVRMITESAHFFVKN